MKTVLPGAAIGLLGGGENSRMLALEAYRIGYRVHVFSPHGDAGADRFADLSVHAPYEDLDRIRKFAAAVDVVTITEGDVPVIALRAAAGSSVVSPSPKVFEAIESGVGTRREAPTEVLADFAIIGARGPDGAFASYTPIAIDRVDCAVDIARSPAPIGAKIARQAVSLTRDMLEDLDLTGTACVEFTLTGEHGLVIHEVTPCPHRAGHLTVDACVTNQFEQQLRAVCGLPLGSTEMLRAAAMAVLPEVQLGAAFTFPQVKLHYCGGRTGHLTALAKSATLAKQIVLAARARLTRQSDV